MASEAPEFEDYYKEFQDIEENKDSSTDDGEEEEVTKTPDEGEQELAWLQDAGYGHLVPTIEEGKVLGDDLIKNETSSLTRTQAAAVKKRIDTLNATIRKRQKQQQKTDVRDLFPPTQAVGDQQDGGQGVNRNQSFQDGKHQRKGSGKSKDVHLFKQKAEYSLTGGTTIRTDVAAGVETLSIQARNQRPKVKSPVADTEIVFDFAVEEMKMSPETKVDYSYNKRASFQTDALNLPNYVLVKDKLGITKVCDLCSSDMQRVRTLALIELTALFDIYDITYGKRKNRKKLKEHGVFGVPLSALLEHDTKKNPNLKVPLIFQQLLMYLESHCLTEEGILRVPGSATRIKALRQELEETFYSGQFSWENCRANDVAAIMKQLLRDLPVPLLTFEYLDAFAQIENISDPKQQLQALNLLILLLPDVHRNTLQMLLKFLNRVASHKLQNKMNLNNVAMIMAPNLFLVQSGRRKLMKINDISSHEVSKAAGNSNIVRMLVRYHEILWTVPSFMVAQVRHQYEVEHHKRSGNKSRLKFLQKKDKSDVYKKMAPASEADFQENVIRVSAPHFSKVATAIQLDETTSAGDIVARFRRQPEKGQIGTYENGKNSSNEELDNSPTRLKDGVYAKENTYLYEIGGNIGERRLDQETNMIALYRVNPNAEWVIKNRVT